jgi:hypothetical protein
MTTVAVEHVVIRFANAPYYVARSGSGQVSWPRRTREAPQFVLVLFRYLGPGVVASPFHHLRHACACDAVSAWMSSPSACGPYYVVQADIEADLAPDRDDRAPVGSAYRSQQTQKIEAGYSFSFAQQKRRPPPSPREGRPSEVSHCINRAASLFSVLAGMPKETAPVAAHKCPAGYSRPCRRPITLGPSNQHEGD